MHALSFYATSRTWLCGGVHQTYHAEDYTRHKRKRPKLRMEILIDSASEEKIEQYNPDSDKCQPV